MAFDLHPRLAADTSWIGDFPLCRLLLIKEAIGPWFILVPKIADLREIHHLGDADQQQLMRESSLLSGIIEKETNLEKMNVAALGNMVPQLHIHHIARFTTDAAWPSPVWGNTPGNLRSEEEQSAEVEKWVAIFASHPEFTAA
ncbi:HIT domain-containing protein [Enterovibrio norvegicus]|uniref:HIT domain-containing protein n=1 Tax=Enterovibrio norvegicus TaxID=188144 RepID=UPI0013D0ACA5|nr:HIT domain-containing protein [Enterovibrio norvegicus]